MLAAGLASGNQTQREFMAALCNSRNEHIPRSGNELMTEERADAFKWRKSLVTIRLSIRLPPNGVFVAGNCRNFPPFFRLLLPPFVFSRSDYFVVAAIYFSRPVTLLLHQRVSAVCPWRFVSIKPCFCSFFSSRDHSGTEGANRAADLRQRDADRRVDARPLQRRRLAQRSCALARFLAAENADETGAQRGEGFQVRRNRVTGGRDAATPCRRFIARHSARDVTRAASYLPVEVKL